MSTSNDLIAIVPRLEAKNLIKPNEEFLLQEKMREEKLLAQVRDFMPDLSTLLLEQAPLHQHITPTTPIAAATPTRPLFIEEDFEDDGFDDFIEFDR